MVKKNSSRFQLLINPNTKFCESIASINFSGEGLTRGEVDATVRGEVDRGDILFPEAVRASMIERYRQLS